MALAHLFMKAVRTTEEHEGDALLPFLFLVSRSEISVTFDSCNNGQNVI